MTANPVELISGITTVADVVKADFVSWAKTRLPEIMASVTEIRNTDLAGQLVIQLLATGETFYLDTADTTTADDGVNCVISADGNRFKPLSAILAPTLVSLGGVYAIAPVSHQWLKSLGTDGAFTTTQPAAIDLSNGVSGSGAVILATGATLITPTLGVATATSINKVALTAPAISATLTLVDGTVVTGPATTDTIVGRATTDTLTNKSINATNNTVTNLTTAMFATNVVDTDGTLTANSDTRVASQKATKTYVDQIVAANDAMVFKGSTDCSANPNYPAADRGHTYRVSVAGKIGGASGIVVEAGDLFMCITDGTLTGNQATVGASWTIAQTNIDGAVVGPASATSANIATFNGTTGKLIQDGGKALPTGTVVGTSDSQTLTNKTLTAPIIATISNTGTLTLPTSTDTLVGKATTDTLTNKTLTAPVITGGTSDALTSLGIRSTGASFDVKFASTEAITATRTVTWVLGDVSRTITLGGNPTINGGTHSGTNTGDQTITLTGDVTGSGTGSFATTIAANAVTLAKMAQVATATFLGRTTAATGNVEALTVTQATALLNVAIGDSGGGGTKGLVPAAGAGDAAAGKFLKADMTYAVPAGGGGGSLSDADRQNILLDRIYQSKSFGDIRRFISAVVTGFNAATDTLRGINAGSSSNYTATPTSAAVSYVAPSLTANSLISTSGKTLVGNMTANGGVAAAFDGNTNQANTAGAATVSNSTTGYTNTVGVDWGSGVTKKIVEFKAYAPNNFGILGSAGGSSLKLQGSTDNFSSSVVDLYTSGTVLTTGGSSIDITSGIDTSTAYRYHRIAINGNTSNSALMAEVQFYEIGTIANMTLVTASQTADASVSNGRALLEIDNSASITLNTDLSVEVTCDGGTNWASASLSSIGIGQAGRLVVETVDAACTAGTSFAARIKTLTNKNVPIYGVALTVH